MTTGFNVKLVTATALLCWAVLAGVSRGDTVRWISQALPPDTVLPDSPVLRVRNAAGTLVAETDRCRIFTGDDTAWIAGRVELPGTERYSVSLRRSQTADEADGDLLLVPALSGSRTRFDVVLLLDASHSMRRNDPRELRKSATRAFCRLSALSPRIRRLSLVRFRREARILVPPTAPSAVRGLDNTLDDLRP